MSFGDKLRDQLDDLLIRYKSKPDTQRGARQRLRYLRAKDTGVTDRRLAQLLGVKSYTLHRWVKDPKQKLSAASMRKIDQVYTSFLRVNQRGRILRKVTGKKPGKIKITGGQDQERHVTISRKQWRTFVTQWSHGDTGGMTTTWTDHLAELSTPELWWEDPTEVDLTA